jgi:hypothetical protein
MSNCSYLCVSDVDTIYPNLGDPNYDCKVQTVAYDVYCVPLLWLALFRPADVRSKVFQVDGQPVTGTAPVVRKTVAFKQLTRALTALNRLFRVEGPLDGYAEMLRAAVADAPGKFVTIELEEIAGIWTPDAKDFYRQLARALGRLELRRALMADRQRLLWISQLRPGKRFPSARCFLDGHQVTDDDCVNHCRLLGTAMIRPVPWLPAP